MVKRKSNNMTMILVAVLSVLAIAGSIVYVGQQNTAIQGGNMRPVSRMDIELDFDSYVASAQDDADDVEWHVFYLGESDDLTELKSNNYFNCDSAFNNPLVLDPSKTQVDIDRGLQYIGVGIEAEPYFCEPNWYKLFQEASVEDNMVTDGLESVALDLGVVDADDGATEEATLSKAGKYLIVFREITTGEVGDVIGGAIVVERPESVDASKLTQDTMDNINDGTTNIRISYKYLSDAFAESKVTIFGNWEDDENNKGTLDESLNGFCDSSLTTNTSIDLDIEYGFRIDEDGYAMILDNPLASGNSELGYMVLTPYGENATSGVWQEYNTNSFTGDVGYSASFTSTADQITFQAETTGDCLHTLVSSSSADAVVDGDEKLYDCFTGKNVKNEDAEVSWTLFVDEVYVDYDQAVASNDEVVACNSGSSGDNLFDVDIVTPVASTDRMANTISP